MLKLSTDRKTATGFTKAGKPRPNTFGLPAGKAFSCPGATAECEKVCYAGKLEKVYQNVRESLLSNFNALKACGDDVSAMQNLLRDMLKEYDRQATKFQNAKRFRLHWDGDFYSRAYAQAWANVIREFPQVQFWVYTRSFVPELNVLDIICGLPNLTVYMSVDDANKQYAAQAIVDHGVLVARMSRTVADAKQGTEGAKGMPCPELLGKLPLLNACNTCGLCIEGRKDVIFSTSGK